MRFFGFLNPVHNFTPVDHAGAADVEAAQAACVLLLFGVTLDFSGCIAEAAVQGDGRAYLQHHRVGRDEYSHAGQALRGELGERGELHDLSTLLARSLSGLLAVAFSR